jgi:glycosyltransferase involved in cell wall biosynthesis
VRLWIVSELYWPEQTSTGYFMTGIAEGLASDYDVRVLCGQPTYSARGVKGHRQEIHNGVTIFRCLGTRFDKDRILLRLVNAASLSVSIGWGTLRRVRRGDVVLVVTNPPTLPFVVLATARLRGARVLLRIEDVYPNVILAAGMMRPISMGVRVIERLTRLAYRKMHRVIVLGRDMAALAAAKVADRSRIVLISNWGDVDAVTPTPRADNKLLSKLGVADRFVVQYMGNMGRTHGVETVATAAMALRDRDDLYFLFVGWGGRKAWLEQTVREEKLENIAVLPGCPPEELSDHLNACDVSVVAFVKGMAGVSVPSRMYNVMAAGKPILAVCDPESELARVVREERIGWVVPPEDRDALVAAIDVARRDPAELVQMGLRARAAALRSYSKAAVLTQYRSMLQALDAAAP